MADEVKINRIKELNAVLKKASEDYYAKDESPLSDREYDALYDELVKLEEETGVILAGSPTQTVGYEAVDELPKERHPSPMLSLGKTKSREELADWLGDHEGVLSWKLDGLTVVLTYNNGELSKAVTRGNGEIGEVITPNARVFDNVPLKISFVGELVVRGEAVISYKDFEKINASIVNDADKYKNPRNLCSGSVRQLDSKITAGRHVRFVAFNLVYAAGEDGGILASADGRLSFLESLGFEAVERVKVTSATVVDAVGEYEKKISGYDIPSDGLVLTYDDVDYGISLGRTAKSPRNAIAFKWADETAETTLREIEWSASRTGLINPVAIFDPVELEGTTVTRASVHNVSIVRELKLGIGDRITVYKANMIIPQIAENLTKSGNVTVPDKCPVCGAPTEIRALNEAESLYCTNADCPAKQIKTFSQFVSRDALNIDGLSEMTLEKLIDMGFIKEFTDLFHLDRYKEKIVNMEGFGDKSYSNLIESIKTASKTTLPRFLFGLGIPGIGVANAKVLAKAFDHDIEKIRKASAEELSEVEGIGDIMAADITKFFADEDNNRRIDAVLADLTLEVPVNTSAQNLAGLTFVITGSLERYENRNALKAEIENRGGKVAGSVSAKTTALINNDAASNSSKNKTAKSLGVTIITEDDFINTYLKE
ncbi:MAG: NAD-dependent DNA ligase LigA [Lachnospiraceae bacterium]|nr:NAD-dependent DNA ligase LigA [Lachnospiraceae bacterium]